MCGGRAEADCAGEGGLGEGGGEDVVVDVDGRHEDATEKGECDSN